MTTKDKELRNVKIMQFRLSSTATITTTSTKLASCIPVRVKVQKDYTATPDYALAKINRQGCCFQWP
jgi:hypothetical protein